MEACTRRCDGNHKHAHCLGGVKINGKWMNVSDFAGGYTAQFARQVIRGAEEYLQKGQEEREVFTEGGSWPEEDFSEEEVPEDEEGKEDEMRSPEDGVSKVAKDS